MSGKRPQVAKQKPDPTQGASRALLGLAEEFSRKFPILDAGCGFGRNAIALAELGFSVVCAERDPRRLDVLMKAAASKRLARSLFPIHVALGTANWPFAPASFSAIIFVHYLDTLLFPSIYHSLVPDGALYVETVGGQGQNYLELPQQGELRSLLSPHFRLVTYRERSVGPTEYNRCAVRLLAKKHQFLGT
jgi:SAM-dependent methyltransferase